MRHRWTILVGIAGTLFLTLVAAGYATFAGARQQEIMISHRNWLIHTYNVLVKLEEIDTALEELLSSERGYIIKQEKSFSDDFDKSQKSMDAAVAKLYELVADNPTQVQRVEFLKRTLERRKNFLRDAMSASEKDGFQNAKKFVNTRGHENAETQADDILHEMISRRERLT